jgi:hypothetical protein
MSDIFLSYKSEDRPKAKISAEALERHGYSVWWDRIIPPGKTFDQVIEEALDAAKCVIVLWSKESVISDWVKNEAREGARRRILVPVLIDDVKIPFEFRHIQAAQLIDWQGTLPNPEFDLLLESVGQILGKPIVMKMEEKKLSINEINISEKRDGEKKLPSKIAPKWKWGSMIVSLGIVIFFWFIGILESSASHDFTSIHLIWGIFAIPAIVYLMYKERTEKIRYGLVWILIVSVLWVWDSFIWSDMITGLFYNIPAFIIDIIYVYKTR